MNIEVGAIIVDTVTALSAVVGVIVAARLGQKAVRVAKETVDRSERDYAASRVDAVGDAYASVIHAMANIKADLHIFWKDDLDDLMASAPDSPRVHEIEDRNHKAEVEVHRDVYLLSSACVGLSKAVDAVRLSYNSVQIPESASVERVSAATDLYYGSVFPHYLTLLSSDKKNVPIPLKNEDKFIDWFMLQVGLDEKLPASKNIEMKSVEWLKNYLRNNKTQASAEIVAINFIDQFALKELDAALAEVVNPIMDVCRPVIVDARLTRKR